MNNHGNHNTTIYFISLNEAMKISKIKKLKSIGFNFNGEIFNDTYSHFKEYKFDVHDLENK